jgi:wyosine [tRNA(Phe)-imidazoG37] synthetase (radical SAM superfamily)
MAILFEQLVFGPVNSRRFGVSLGINVLPNDNKLCNFNCIYCECGWTDLRSVKNKFVDKEILKNEMEQRFAQLHQQKKHFDAITFAGNGEPTMHPDFPEIIAYTCMLRDKYFPEVKVIVLSNSSMLANEPVFKALQKADLRVMKLDAGSNEMFRIIDQPLNKHDLNWVIEKLLQFKGDLYIQTMFLHGNYNNVSVDNTTEAEVNLWLNHLQQLKPKHVMIYTLDRGAPASNLQKVSKSVLDAICERVIKLGISAKVYN